ncbi:hypothetical protein Aduo_010444 [Ancylostoma duodenale]
MKWFAIVVCVALFCFGLVESAPSKKSDTLARDWMKGLKSGAKKAKREAKKDTLARGYMKALKTGAKKS